MKISEQIRKAGRFSEQQLEKVQKQWGKIAGEKIIVEEHGGTLYAFGSELAMLRLYHKWGGKAVANPSKNLHKGKWFFRAEK